MRVSLKSTLGWLGLAAFLVLPNCTLDRSGLGPPVRFNPGTQPWDSAIFCDVESQTAARHCATPDEQSTGIPLAQAAVALVKGQSSNVGLDYSPAAITAAGCAPGQPVAITFLSPFPVGISKCLNCGASIGPVYTDVNAACVDVCRDMNFGGDAFCADSTKIHRASTNAGSCFAGACTANALSSSFVDPRRTPEPVSWTNLVGVATSGADSNTLTRTAASTSSFDAGAASTQTITHGDAYVEFTATETDKGRICGFSTGGPPDTDPTANDIAFGIHPNATGGVRVFEGGVALAGPNPDLSFASYASGDRLRVSVADNFDGTGTISYSLIPASCAGAGCTGMVLRTVGGAVYPLRVDTSFNQQGSTLTDVRIVRIK